MHGHMNVKFVLRVVTGHYHATASDISLPNSLELHLNIIIKLLQDASLTAKSADNTFRSRAEPSV
jgi:hypothetical protein